MASLALSFNNVNFSPVQQDGQIWLSSSELAKALDYKQVDAVTKVYNRNSDEFTEKMTQVIDNPQAPNLGVRIEISNASFTLKGLTYDLNGTYSVLSVADDRMNALQITLCCYSTSEIFCLILISRMKTLESLMIMMGWCTNIQIHLMTAVSISICLKKGLKILKK